MEDIVARLWYLSYTPDPMDILPQAIILYPDILTYKNPEHYGATLLHLFVCRNNYEMCCFCLNNGADVDSRDNGGRTPLRYLSYPSDDLGDISIKIIDLLLDYGANINSVDNQGVSVINWCCNYGNLKQVLHLLKQGVDVNNELHGRTCLRGVIQNQHREIFWAVLKGGAYIENDKDTVMYFKLRDFFYYSYYNNNLDLLRKKIAFCSVKVVNRMGSKSKLRHLPMDIIRKLFSEFI